MQKWTPFLAWFRTVFLIFAGVDGLASALFFDSHGWFTRVGIWCGGACIAWGLRPFEEWLDRKIGEERK